VDEKLGEQIPMDLVLKDEEGNDVKIGALVDRPTILTLNYFRCAGICTPLLNGVVVMLNKVQLEPDRDFRVITVSFDGRDTPDIAKRKQVNYLKQMKRPFPPTGWRFLTGDAASTKRLTDAVGFKFKASGEDFIHAGVIVVVSPTGKVTRYMYGVSFLPADVQMALGEALKEQPEPTVSRFLQFCYNYDPEGRRYVFSVTKAAAALVILAAAVFVAFLVVKGRRKKPEETEVSR
jgi:protein SCO1/2